MTDNEMIKFIDHAINSAKGEDGFKEIYWEKLVYILDFINRQQEKIKAFDEKLVIQQGLIDYQKVEIERLKKEDEDKERAYNDEFCLRKEWQSKCRELLKDKQTTKSEAIKEFAEKLKEEIRCEDDCGYHCYDCCYECKDYVPVVDNLVKEMTDKALYKANKLSPISYDKHYYKCPCCKEDLGINDDDIFVYEETPPNFCKDCGQALEWGDVK